MVQAAADQSVEQGGAHQGGERVTRAATLPAGTVLASRYRLEELIAESQPTVTWRAFDQVLSRSVLVHLLAPGDPNEELLLDRRAQGIGRNRFPLPSGA